MSNTRVVIPVDEQRVREIVKEELRVEFRAAGLIVDEKPVTPEWGDPIAVDGKRPAWLTDDSIAKVWNSSDTGRLPSGRVNWPVVQDIVLPADHFAYKAIAAGFEPWGGGDAAPADWDGGETLKRAGHTWPTVEGSDWQRGYASNPNDMADLDIIGYRKRVDAQPDADGDLDWCEGSAELSAGKPVDPAEDRLRRYVIWRRDLDQPGASIETSPYADGMNALLPDLASVLGV